MWFAFGSKTEKGHADSKSLTTFLLGVFFWVGESLIARRESYIQFESKERSREFEKSNDFSDGVFFFGVEESLIARRESNIQFESK